MAEPNVPLRRLLTASIIEMLEAATGRGIENAKAPSDSGGDTQDFPYAVVFSGKDAEYYGTPYHLPEADADFRYTIYSYGIRGDQADWMSDQVVAAMIGRDDYGNYLQEITPNGLTVMQRTIGESSGLEDRRGNIYSVMDTFIVSVTTS